MHADIHGALAQIKTSWRAFEHKGKPMTKKQVVAVLNYGIASGYTTTAQLSDYEVDIVLKTLIKP